MSRVHIEVSPNGRDGKVVIDGHDIAKSVTGFTVRGEVGHVTRLELDLRAHDVTTESCRDHSQIMAFRYIDGVLADVQQGDRVLWRASASTEEADRG